MLLHLLPLVNAIVFESSSSCLLLYLFCAEGFRLQLSALVLSFSVISVFSQCPLWSAFDLVILLEINSRAFGLVRVDSPWLLRASVSPSLRGELFLISSSSLCLLLSSALKGFALRLCCAALKIFGWAKGQVPRATGFFSPRSFC